jgi:hypothetical protein
LRIDALIILPINRFNYIYHPSCNSGAMNYLTNIGEIEGKGLELSVGGTVLQANI